MHVRELVEVAGLVAYHGPLITASGAGPSSSCLEQYWSTSKGRCDSWHGVLKMHAGTLNEKVGNCDALIRARATFDEIFVSEILTRVWGAALVACDRTSGSNSEPIVRSVLSSHQEVRQRALAMLLDGRSFTTGQAVVLNRTRRRAERWTDVLVGGLMHLGGVGRFSANAERAGDFAADLARRHGEPGGRQAWRLTLVSLRNAFQSGVSLIAANPDSNARIAASVLGCFPGELFDSTGMFKSLWMTRMTANASDAQGLITQLLSTSSCEAPPKAGAPRHPRRLF